MGKLFDALALMVSGVLQILFATISSILGCIFPDKETRKKRRRAYERQLRQRRREEEKALYECPSWCSPGGKFVESEFDGPLYILPDSSPVLYTAPEAYRTDREYAPGPGAPTLLQGRTRTERKEARSGVHLTLSPRESVVVGFADGREVVVTFNGRRLVVNGTAEVVAAYPDRIQMMAHAVKTTIRGMQYCGFTSRDARCFKLILNQIATGMHLVSMDDHAQATAEITHIH